MTESGSSIARKNAARMVFVQAIYGEHFGIVVDSAESWVESYHEDMLADAASPELEEDEHSEEVFQLKPEALPDMKFLRKLLRGWLEEKAAVENYLTKFLDSKKRPYTRLSPLVQSVLTAGSFEILHSSTKPPVLLKEYTEIAAGFFDNPELGFINGTLQEIADSHK